METRPAACRQNSNREQPGHLQRRITSPAILIIRWNCHSADAHYHQKRHPKALHRQSNHLFPGCRGRIHYVPANPERVVGLRPLRAPCGLHQRDDGLAGHDLNQRSHWHTLSHEQGFFSGFFSQRVPAGSDWDSLRFSAEHVPGYPG